MASYVPLGNIYGEQRLGSFESISGPGLGDFGYDYTTTMQAEMGLVSLHTPEGAKVHTAGERVTEEHSDTGYQARQADDGVSGEAVGQVLTGVGAILAPLAQAGVGIFSATQQAKLERARLKAAARVRQPVRETVFVQQQSSSKAPIILAAVGGMVVLGVLVFALTR